MNQVRPKTVFILYCISGFTALVFEVVWSKQACLIFGNTTLASAAVIAAFMTGLALGSYIFGKLADNKPGISLKLYAILEGCIALFAISFPFLTHILIPVYKSIYLSLYQDFIKISLMRFALSFAVLIIPTTLMGGTFPLLSRFMSQDNVAMDRNISRLYAMNLFGAMLGSFASGYIMIAFFGLNMTAGIAAVLNLGICSFLIYIINRPSNAGTGEIPAENIGEGMPAELFDKPPVAKKVLFLVMGLMFIHGFAAFVIQICWLRIMALILGSSTYAFSAVLTTFLAGLGMGTYAVSILAKRHFKIDLNHIGFMELAIGLSVLVFIPVFEWLIYVFVLWFPVIGSSILLIFATQFIFSVLAMIVPTFLMGLVYPSVICYLGRPQNIGKLVGTSYAVNTLGGVIGCFSAAFLFITNFGLNGSLHIVSLLSVATGFFIIVVHTWKTPKLKLNIAVALPVAVFSFFLIFYPWDKTMFSSGVFIYAKSFKDEARLGKWIFQKSMEVGHDILFYKDGMSSTVTVLQHGSSRKRGGVKTKSLRVNGKTDASTVGDMDTQLYLGYVPMFAHHDPKKVLVIGLGAGITLNTVTEFDTVSSIECVEIEPAVAEANHFFSAENNNAILDPRVKLIIGDGRNHLEFTPEKYDVIISEPSNPWISGISNLFSKENYESALKKLEPDGIYCQWFHAYQMSPQDFKMIMHTFVSVFPEVNLFKISSGDYMLLGSRKKISFDYARVNAILQRRPSISNHLKFFTKYGENFLLGCFMLSNADLRTAIDKDMGRLNTDDNLALEYDAPKYLYQPTTFAVMHWLYSINRSDTLPAFKNTDAEHILGAPMAWKTLADNGLYAMTSKNYDSAIGYFDKALKYHPRDPALIFALARSNEKMKDYISARKYYESLMHYPKWRKNAKSSLRRIRLKDEIEKNPLLWRNAKLFNLLGGLSFFAGDMEDTEQIMLKAIDIDPRYAKNYSDLALYYFLSGNNDKGYRMLQKSRFYNVRDVSAKRAEELWATLNRRQKTTEVLRSGRAYLVFREYDKAKRLFEGLVKEDPQNPLAYLLLAKAEEGLGHIDTAKQYIEKARELHSRRLGQVRKESSEISPRKTIEINTK